MSDSKNPLSRIVVWDSWPRLTFWRAAVVYFGLLVVGGVFAGLLWHLLSTPPSYVIGDDHGAIITEQGLSQAFAMDIWYLFIGMAVGLLLGAAGWGLFYKIGWPVVIGVIIGALIAAVVAWQVGCLIGPNDFADRVVAAVPGDRVPMDLQLHSLGLMLIWPLAASVPVLGLALWNQFRRAR